MKKSDAYYVVIVGCGRLGASLANRMSAGGHSVVVIDSDPSAFDGLSVEFSGFRVEGNGTESSVLRQAKVQQADILIASTSEDNINLMVAQVASKIYGVPHVVARIFDPKREQTFRVLGVETICPTVIASDVLLDSIAGSITHKQRD